VADSLDELVPVMRDVVPLIRNRLADKYGIDTEIGDAGTGRSREEWFASLQRGATKATSFGKTWHAKKKPTDPPTAEGLVLSCAIDLWIAGTRSSVTGRPTSLNWNCKDFLPIGEAYESEGLISGCRFKNQFDGPHGQGPHLARPGPEHWAMSPSDLDDFCREEINLSRRLRGLAPLGRSAWV